MDVGRDGDEKTFGAGAARKSQGDKDDNAYSTQSRPRFHLISTVVVYQKMKVTCARSCWPAAGSRRCSRVFACAQFWP
jgi:hypothetical protein